MQSRRGLRINAMDISANGIYDRLSKSASTSQIRNAKSKANTNEGYASALIMTMMMTGQGWRYLPNMLTGAWVSLQRYSTIQLAVLKG
jgi:hypothetical protein